MILIKKVVVMTCMWKRPKLTDYIFKRWAKEKELCRDTLDVTLLAVGSEGTASRVIAEKNGFIYREFENFPLNRKNNFASLSAKEFDPEVVVYVNSDTLFSFGALKNLVDKSDPVSFVGLRNLYNFSPRHKRMSLWNGWESRESRHLEPIGTGRCFSKNILENVGWHLWDNAVEINKGLDYNCKIKLTKIGFSFKSYTMKDLDLTAVEVKTETNIWKWESLKHRKIFGGLDLNKILTRLDASDIYSVLETNKSKSSLTER